MIIAIGNFIGGSSSNPQGSEPIDDWILVTGFWDDNGFWRDSATWDDPPYSLNYQIVMAQANSEAITLPSEAQMTKDSDFLTAIDSIWSKVKGIKMFKNDGTRVSDFALIDWKNPDLYRAELVASPTYDSNGYYSNGTTSYVDSKLPISLANQQSFCIFSKGINNAGQAGSFLLGCSNVSPGSSGSTFINPRNTSDNFSYQAASTTQQAVSGTTDARNRLCIGRTSGNHFHSINGANKVINANTYSPVSPTSETFYICADNGLSGASGFNTRGSSYLIYTDDLTNEEIAIMDAALATWLS